MTLGFASPKNIGHEGKFVGQCIDLEQQTFVVVDLYHWRPLLSLLFSFHI